MFRFFPLSSGNFDTNPGFDHEENVNSFFEAAES